MAGLIKESYHSTSTGWRSFNSKATMPYNVSSGFVPGWGSPTFEDHFEGNSLNSTYWQARNGYQDAQDGSTMRPANVVVENSMLKLIVQRQTDNGRLYTSGYVDSNAATSRPWAYNRGTAEAPDCRYGRFEFRARLPTQPNVTRVFWPAMWFRDITGMGEIDLMESIGSPNDQMATYPASPGRFSSSLYEITGSRVAGDGYWSQIFNTIDVADNNFHVWALEWVPGTFRFFCDGRLMHESSAAEYESVIPGFSMNGLNIRLNVFVGSSWAGFPDEAHPEWTVVPNQLEIDYFRFWRYLG